MYTTFHQADKAAKIKEQDEKHDDAKLMCFTKNRYVNILEGKIGRLEKNISPLNMCLSTYDFSSCNIIILIGEKRMSLIHADYRITANDILAEIEWTGADKCEGSHQIIKRPEASWCNGYQTLPFSIRAKFIQEKANDQLEGIGIKWNEEDPDPYMIIRNLMPLVERHPQEQLMLRYYRTVPHLSLNQDKRHDPIMFSGKSWSEYKADDLQLSDIAAKNIHGKINKNSSFIAILKFLRVPITNSVISGSEYQKYFIEIDRMFLLQEFLHLPDFNPIELLVKNVKSLANEIMLLVNNNNYVFPYIAKLKKIAEDKQQLFTALNKMSKDIDEQLAALRSEYEHLRSKTDFNDELAVDSLSEFAEKVNELVLFGGLVELVLLGYTQVHNKYFVLAEINKILANLKNKYESAYAENNYTAAEKELQEALGNLLKLEPLTPKLELPTLQYAIAKCYEYLMEINIKQEKSDFIKKHFELAQSIFQELSYKDEQKALEEKYAAFQKENKDTVQSSITKPKLI